jgi:hypothetical protein
MPSEILVESAVQCSLKGCDEIAEASLSLQLLCRHHLIATCRQRLDAAIFMASQQPRSVDSAVSVAEISSSCRDAANELMKNAQDLSRGDQAKLMDILLRVQYISQLIAAASQNPAE